jgi:hypothetical protein
MDHFPKGVLSRRNHFVADLRQGWGDENILVPLLLNVLVFRKVLVLASIGRLDMQTQYFFLEAALA